MDSTIVNEIEIAIHNAIWSGVDSWARRATGPERWFWKVEIMSALSKLGGDLDYEVHVGPYCDPVNEAAWLWDMAWLRVSDANNNLLSVPLAVELEWETKLDYILLDFRKLLVSRAGLRVMIFRAAAHNASDRLGRLIQEIQQYSGTQKGDKYLLGCCYCEDAERLEFRDYVVE